MPNIKNLTELDFESESLDVKESVSQQASIIVDKISLLKNPYTGNKKKLVPHLFDFIEERGYRHQRFLDLFAGSSVVSATARGLGCNVIANDLMRYPHVNAKFILHGDGTRLSDKDIEDLFKVDYTVDFFSKKYKEYFTDNEIQVFSSYRANMEKLLLNDEKKYYFAFAYILHYIIDSCFVGGRLNKGQVLAKLDHRIAHARNKGREMDFKSINMYPVFPWEKKSQQCDVFRLDANELLRSDKTDNIDLCYADPPYGGDQSDYAHMYEFFDEYVNMGQIKEDPNREKFISSKNYISSFRELLSDLKKIPVVIFSYNDSSWGSIDAIKTEIKGIGRKVFVKEIRYRYKYRSSSSSTEYLIAME